MLREVDAPDANPQRALPRTKGEILPLTSFRAWAALLVVAHHDLVHYHQSMLAGGVSIPIRPGESAIPWHVGMLSEARVGVTMFFVLSGFLLTLRYWTAPFDAQGWKNYLAKRVARIWPLYLAVCALQFAFEVYKGHEGLIHYVSYFTLTQGFFGDIKFWGVSTAWSLTVEECFYLVLPLLLLLFRRFEPAGRTSGWRWYLPKAAVVAATTGALALIGYALARQPWFKLWGFFESEGGHWVGYTICGRFVDFAAGILAALIYLRSSNRALANPLAANAGFVAGALLLLGSMHLSFYYPFQGPFPLEPYHPLSVLASALLVYFLCAPTSFVARAASARSLVCGLIARSATHAPLVEPAQGETLSFLGSRVTPWRPGASLKHSCRQAFRSGSPARGGYPSLFMVSPRSGESGAVERLLRTRFARQNSRYRVEPGYQVQRGVITPRGRADAERLANET
jgi:peptidoglycan/LPS O-acetylase OafA/YrhL